MAQHVPIDIHKLEHPQVWKIKTPDFSGAGLGGLVDPWCVVGRWNWHFTHRLLMWVVARVSKNAPFPPNLEDLKYSNILKLCKLSDVLPFKLPSCLVAKRGRSLWMSHLLFLGNMGSGLQKQRRRYLQTWQAPICHFKNFLRRWDVEMVDCAEVSG